MPSFAVFYLGHNSKINARLYANKTTKIQLPSNHNCTPNKRDFITCAFFGICEHQLNWMELIKSKSSDFEYVDILK